MFTSLTHYSDATMVPCEFDLIYVDLIQAACNYPDFETFSVHRPLVSDVYSRQYPLTCWQQIPRL